MGKIKLSSMVTDIRGSVGGHVFLKGKGGAIVRMGVTQRSKQRAVAQLFRVYFTVISQTWRTLSQTQRDSWEAAATFVSTTDSIGNVMPLCGFTYYKQLNWFRKVTGNALLVLPPKRVGVTRVTIVTFSIAVGSSNMVFSISPATVPANTESVLYLTGSLSKGVSANNQKYRIFTGQTPGTDFSGAYAAYVANFGTPIVGSKVFAKLINYNITTGEASKPQYASCVVTA